MWLKQWYKRRKCYYCKQKGFSWGRMRKWEGINVCYECYYLSGYLRGDRSRRDKDVIAETLEVKAKIPPEYHDPLYYFNTCENYKTWKEDG